MFDGKNCSQADSSALLRYISLQATESLGLHDNIRQEVEVKICDMPGPRWDSFAVAKATVLERLKKVKPVGSTPVKPV